MQSHDSYVREYNVIEYKGYVRLLIDVVARSVDWPWCQDSRVSTPESSGDLKDCARRGDSRKEWKEWKSHVRTSGTGSTSMFPREGGEVRSSQRHPRLALGRIRRPCAGAQVASTRWFTYGTAQPG